MTDLLEDAIRAGVARGMDEAPVVPDLAERVRALPSGQRNWKLPVAAAAAVVVLVVLVSVGVAANVSHTSANGPLTLPDDGSPSVGSIPVPPFPISHISNDSATATRAAGTWDPIWVADFDGPMPTNMPLTVTHATPSVVRVRAACEPEPSVTGSLTPTGEVVGTSRSGAVGACLFDGRYTDASAAAWAAAYGRFTRVSVAADGESLTLYDAGSPVAQLLVRDGPVRRLSSPFWSYTGSLPSAVQGRWHLQYDRRRTAAALPKDAIVLADGKVSGSARCYEVAGTYRVAVMGEAAFPTYEIQAHSCPATAAGAPRDPAAWEPPAGLAKMGVYRDLLTLYDKSGQVLAIFHRA